ncbi:MAG: hypothetical protein ACYCVO_16275 [Acidimicrobiales bacterium]
MDLGDILESPTINFYDPTQIGGKIIPPTITQQPTGVGARNTIYSASTNCIDHENIKNYGGMTTSYEETNKQTFRPNELELRGEIKNTAPTTTEDATIKISESSDKALASSDISKEKSEMEEESPQITHYQLQLQEVIQEQNTQITSLQQKFQQI